MTSSSSPGISLKQEGISYIAGSELPASSSISSGAAPVWAAFSLLSPTTSSHQGGGHDYHLFVFAPASVQEMVDLIMESLTLPITATPS